jgi:hypothetical protein
MSDARGPLTISPHALGSSSAFAENLCQAPLPTLKRPFQRSLAITRSGADNTEDPWLHGTGERDFVISPLAAKPPLENARPYDELASGRMYVESDPIGLQGGSYSTYAYVGGNPVSGIDPFGLCGCRKGYLDCVADCIRNHDPLNSSGKGLLTAVGGTFPKAWIGLPQGLGGASPLTTIPSAGATATGGGAAGTAGAVARAVGRIFSPLWTAYGDYLFGLEVYCASSCAGDNCAH